jgi:hypothetical protein
VGWCGLILNYTFWAFGIAACLLDEVMQFVSSYREWMGGSSSGFGFSIIITCI